jgi:catechol 2,3-dioxygenase-like lactoylglutathione lyase family enzyme
MIDGVGGAFVFSNDAQRLADWYREYLGLEFEGAPEYGAFYQMFWGLDPHDPTRRIDTTFSIMQAKVPLEKAVLEVEPEDMYGDQPFMVNLRVRDIDALLESLSSKGVEPIKRENHSYGRFAWIRDLDGNRVELYQPLMSE